MRGLLPAIAVCLLLAGTLSLRAPAQSAPAPPAAPAKPPAAAKPLAPATAGSADNDAAARHAKRTACIKEARAKKLVGGQKTAYIKDCASIP
jgi:hypothetical protein